MPARATHHQPIWQRLCRRSCNGWPVSRWCLSEWANTSTASGVEHPQDEVKDAIIAQFALWPTLGHREVRQDKCLELGFGELDRNRRRYRLLGCCAHQAMASWEE